jgi:hypothetical protein
MYSLKAVVIEDGKMITYILLNKNQEIAEMHKKKKRILREKKRLFQKQLKELTKKFSSRTFPFEVVDC